MTEVLPAAELFQCLLGLESAEINRIHCFVMLGGNMDSLLLIKAHTAFCSLLTLSLVRIKQSTLELRLTQSEGCCGQKSRRVDLPVRRI